MDFVQTLSNMLFTSQVKYQVEAKIDMIQTLLDLSKLHGEWLDDIWHISNNHPPRTRHLLLEIDNTADHLYNYRPSLFGIFEERVCDYYFTKLPRLLTEMYWVVWADKDTREQ